jgi:O-acetyl-ADP-ribose deacetylase (regulator of RNase III)
MFNSAYLNILGSVEGRGFRDDMDRRKPAIVPVQSLQRWNTVPIPDPDPADEDLRPIETEADGAPSKPLPFPYDEELNAKIILWKGDICSLDVDAIVNTTNERLESKAGNSARILYLGGPPLEHEIRKVGSCPTGDAVLTPASNLIPRHVIHTVGPRFSLKYQTAAENALHGCYRRSLEELKEKGLREIAFCVINTTKKGYPRRPAAHIAFRTVRKFLLRYGADINTVIFCVDLDVDWDTYLDLLPLYFPRSEEEARSGLHRLPHDLGNDIGETVIEERQIRIGNSIGGEGGSGIDEQFIASPKPYNPVPYAERKSESISSSFSSLQDHPDDVRLKRDSAKPKAEQAALEQERVYHSYLRKANDTDLSDMAALKFVYLAGRDFTNRPVIAFVACNLPPPDKVDMERVMLYMLKILDPLVSSDYNLIYFHSLFAASNKPPFAWLKQLYTIFNRKYKKNLKRLFIVHPTFWTKLATWFAKPFVSKKVWNKVIYIERLREIYEYLDPTKTVVPDKIQQYDEATNGDLYKKLEGLSTNKPANEGL